MSGALEPGCLAVIIESVDGHSTGMVVQCVRIVGEHSKFGTVWHVRCRDKLITEFGAVGNEADVPAIWLKKIEPGSDLLVTIKDILKTEKI